MTNPLYSGEAWLRNWSETAKGGRRITLQIEEEGFMPFKGYEGERFAVVIVPIGNDDKPMVKKSLGDAPTREDGGARSSVLATPRTAEPLGTSPAKSKKRWNEMPASQRAALLTQDDEFQRYAEEMGASLNWGMSRTTSHTDRWLKAQCHVESKSELRPGTLAHARYLDIEGNFQAWRQAKQLGAA